MSEPTNAPETPNQLTAPSGNYFRESLEELRKVNWPTRDEVIQGTQTVLIFVIGFTLLLWVGDLLFRNLVSNVIFRYLR